MNDFMLSQSIQKYFAIAKSQKHSRYFQLIKFQLMTFTKQITMNELTKLLNTFKRFQMKDQAIQNSSHCLLKRMLANCHLKKTND